MKSPQRYISVNTNIAWKIEGCFFETIDIKNIINITLKDKEIYIEYTCDQCEQIHTKSYYPNTGLIGTTLIGMKIERLMNAWSKYKEYLTKYQYKHSKLSSITNTNYYNDEYFNDEIENYDEEDYE